MKSFLSSPPQTFSKASLQKWVILKFDQHHKHTVKKGIVDQMQTIMATGCRKILGSLNNYTKTFQMYLKLSYFWLSN